MIPVRFLSLLVCLFLITSLVSTSSTNIVVHSQTASANATDLIWPQASDLPLQQVTTLSGLNCRTLKVKNGYLTSGKSLIVLNSVITNTVIFPWNFSLQNASIKFVNTRLRVIRESYVYLLLLPGASLEFHNCTVVPPNEHQPWSRYCSNSSGCYTYRSYSDYYAQGLQLMIAQNSAEYDIIIKGCTYRFVSEDKSFLLNASTMPYGFVIKMDTIYDNMFNYSFRNIQIVDNYFETNHGPMNFFAVRFSDDFSSDSESYYKRQLTGNLINISGNTAVIRQIEGDDLMLIRESFHAVLGPQVRATLQLRYMFLDDNKIDVRGVTLKSSSTLVVFSQGINSNIVFFGMKRLSVSRNKAVMIPTFSYGLHRGRNSSIYPSETVYELQFLSINGLNHVDDIIINDNDVFITTSIAYGFYLLFKTNPDTFTNGKTPIAATTSTGNIGNVTITGNKLECSDTLGTTLIRIYFADLCENFESFFISHNNISAVIDQRNSNFTSYLNHEFGGVWYRGVVFSGDYGIISRFVRRITTTYNAIHLEGMPQLFGVANFVNLQDCSSVEYSFNNVTLILDDNTFRSADFASAINENYGSFGYALRITQNVLRISKLEFQQNTILVVSKTGANDLAGIDVVSVFDFRNRTAAEINPAIVPAEFKDRPRLIYKNASIWNNTVKMLTIGNLNLGLTQSAIRVGSLDSSTEIGYFYVFNNILKVLTNQPSPVAGTNGISVTTTDVTRNVSEVIIFNNKIRVSGVSGIVIGICLQAATGAAIGSKNFVLGKVYLNDADTKNFKKMVVENNDIQVSNLRGTAAAISIAGAGIFQIEVLELTNNVVLLTSRSLTEFFGSDPIFAPYSNFAGIDASKLPNFPLDQHSYFYALCPYGTLFGFFNIETRNGLAVSVGKMTIENEQITLEKSGSFFSTKLGFYITEYLNVRNINMKSLGTADGTFRRSVVSSIYNIDSSSLAFQGLEYFSSVFPRIAKISVINSIFSIQLPSSCSDILNSNDKTILNNQLSFINILPAPSTTVATTIVGDLIIQNVSFTQDCSASSNLPASTSSFNNIINIPKAATANTRTSVSVSDLNILSLPKSNTFMSHCNGNILASTSTSSSSTSATTDASIESTSWNEKIMVREWLNSAEADFISNSSLPRGKCQLPGKTPTKTNSRSDTSAEVFSPSTTKSVSLIVNITNNNTRISFFSSSITSTSSTATIISGFVAASASAAGLAVRTQTILPGVEEIMMKDCGSPFTEDTFETLPAISASPTRFYISGPKNGGYTTGLILGDVFLLLLVVGGWFGCMSVIEKYVKPLVLSKMKSKKNKNNNNNYVESIFTTSFAAKSKVMIPAVNFGLILLGPMFDSSIALLFIKEVGMGWKIIGVVISILLLVIGFFFCFVIYKLLIKRRKIEKFHKFDRFELKTSENPCGKVWYFFMRNEGVWMCPKVGKIVQIHNNNKQDTNNKSNNNKSKINNDDDDKTIVVTENDEELFRLAEPVIDGFTNRFPRFAIVEILTILCLALALVIGHATANCTLMGVFLLLPVAVHLLIVVYYRPDQELLLRICIPVTDLLQVMIVGLSLGGVDEEVVIILATVLITLQMILFILFSILALTKLVDVLREFGILSCTCQKTRERREEELFQSLHLDELLADFGNRKNTSQQHKRERNFSHSANRLQLYENRDGHQKHPSNYYRPSPRDEDCEELLPVTSWSPSSRHRSNNSSPRGNERRRGATTISALSSFYFSPMASTKMSNRNQDEEGRTRPRSLTVVETAAKDLNDPRYLDL